MFGDTTNKVYRINDWENYDSDVIIVASGVLFNTPSAELFDITAVPKDYGLFELIEEAFATTISTGIGGLLPSNVGSVFFSDGGTVLAQRDLATAASFYFSELTTNGSLVHQFWFRDRHSSNYEIGILHRQSVRSNSGGNVHLYSEGMFLQTALTELQDILLTTATTAIGNRWVLRAWRTQPRMKQNGAEYDPGMA
jgi:hypothetical protein